MQSFGRSIKEVNDVKFHPTSIRRVAATKYPVKYTVCPFWLPFTGDSARIRRIVAVRRDVTRISCVRITQTIITNTEHHSSLVKENAMVTSENALDRFDCAKLLLFKFYFYVFLNLFLLFLFSVDLYRLFLSFTFTTSTR
jgi:hypothetical protein